MIAVNVVLGQHASRTVLNTEPRSVAGYFEDVRFTLGNTLLFLQELGLRTRETLNFSCTVLLPYQVAVFLAVVTLVCHLNAQYPESFVGCSALLVVRLRLANTVCFGKAVILGFCLAPVAKPDTRNRGR